ncbi:MAG: dTMP kinase, partial [Candidatus Micrarchaeota archaeon]
MIVVIEGIDGCGKDTQIELLRKEMKFEYFKYPTKDNQEIKDYLEKKGRWSSGANKQGNENMFLDKEGMEIMRLFLDDIYAEQKKLAEASKKGLVIVDRYVFSTIAYQAEKIGSGIARIHNARTMGKANFGNDAEFAKRAPKLVTETIARSMSLGINSIERDIDNRQFIKPNKVILLDIPSSISFERKKRQKQLDRHEADKEFLERVRQNFL